MNSHNTHRQLTFAREYRGITQTELASRVSGLSQSNLSKYEKGLSTLSDDLLSRIMDSIGFPMAFLDVSIRNEAEDKHYRKKASVSKSARGIIDRFVSIVAYCYDWMCDMMDFPSFGFSYFDIESGFTPEEVARNIRRKLRLGVEPVRNIVNLIEANGIVVYMWDCRYDDFDGVSMITDRGNHIIIVNRNMSNDRVRFTLAHELGHILMHQSVDFVISESRDREKEANAFASEFLLPSQALKTQLVGMKFSDLPALKRYWHASMASIVRRSYDLGCMDRTKYTTFMTELSRNGWRKNEPYPVDIDNAVLFTSAYSLLSNELGYSDSTIADLTSLPLDVVGKVYNNRRVIRFPVK